MGDARAAATISWMASSLIAVVLIVAVATVIPVRLWVSRALGAFRPRPTRPRYEHPPVAGLSPQLARFLAATVELRGAIGVVGPVATEFRETLPFLTLFFAHGHEGRHVRRDRWVVDARASYEDALAEVSKRFRLWLSAVEDLGPATRSALGPAIESLLAAGKDPRVVLTGAELRRVRFSESVHVIERQACFDEMEQLLFELQWAVKPELGQHRDPFRQ